jgi:hypothetical protein
MIWAQYLFLDAQCFLKERLGSVEIFFLPVKVAQIIQSVRKLCPVRVRPFLSDLQRSYEKWLCLVEGTYVVIKNS